LFAEKLREKSH